MKLRKFVGLNAAIALSFSTLAAIAPQAAIARPDTRAMTCAQAQALVKQQGAVVMSTGTHTYQRFVSTRAYCDRSEITWPLYAPTRDNAQCFVAYYCKEQYRPFR